MQTMEKAKALIEVQNVAGFAKTQPYPFWVCEIVDNSLWFVSAYRTLERANDAAKEIGGMVVERIEKNGN